MGFLSDLFDIKGGISNFEDVVLGQNAADAAGAAADLQVEAGQTAIEFQQQALEEQREISQPFVDFGQGFIPQAQDAFGQTQQLINAGRPGQRPLSPFQGNFAPGQTNVSGFVPGQTNVSGFVPGQSNVAGAVAGAGEVTREPGLQQLGQNISIGDVLSGDEFGQLAEINQRNLLSNQAVGGRVGSSDTTQLNLDRLLTTGSQILGRERGNQLQRGQFNLGATGQQFGQGLAAQGQAFGQGLVGQQQQFGQDFSRGQLGLSQQGQQFGQDVTRGQLGLQQQQQQFGQDFNLGQFQLQQQGQQFGQQLTSNQFLESQRQQDIQNQMAQQAALFGGVTFGGNQALGVGSQIAQTGANISNLQTGIGNAQAAGLVGAANAESQAFGNLVGFGGSILGGLAGGGFFNPASAPAPAILNNLSFGGPR